MRLTNLWIFFVFLARQRVIGNALGCLANCPQPLQPTNGANCPQPLQPTNGHVAFVSTGPIRVGDVARVFCNRHYTFYRTSDDMKTIRCQPNNRWERLPLCKPIHLCSDPPSKAGGRWRITGGGPGDMHSVTRAMATFECNRGYFYANPGNCSLSAPLVAFCDNNLQWTSQSGRRIPRLSIAGFRCLASMDCNSDPGDIGNGTRTGSCCSNSNAITYSCNSGYFLIGSRKLTCVNGRWNNLKPHCTVSCLLDIKDGKIVKNAAQDSPTSLPWARNNDRVTVVCDSGYTSITGDGEVRCNGGQWDPTPLCVQRGIGFDINSETGLDIYFLIDSSASVTLAHFKKAIEFVKAFVKKVGVTISATGTRIGATTFSGDIVHQFGNHNGFHTNSRASPELIVRYLDGLIWGPGGTNIRGALEFVERMMLPMSLASRSGAKQYLFLLSDGDDNVGRDAIPVAERLKAPMDISTPSMEIFCVKIGLDDNAETKVRYERRLRKISSEDELNADGKDPHFFRLNDFPAVDILVKLIVNRTEDYSECGIAGVRTGISTANIMNGQLAAPHAWPWMASILIRKLGERGHNAFKHNCGGTLINSQWILTAASCFKGEIYESSLDRIRVKLGSNQWKLNEAGTGESEVLSMHIHRGWQVNATKYHPPGTPFANDIALLRLKEPVRFTNNTRTICLANSSQEHDKFYSGGLVGVVAGWGFSENRTVAITESVSTRSANLRHVKLPVVQKNATGDGPCNPPAQEKVVCAGSSRMEDSCIGDAGGPLMVAAYVGAGERRWYGIGIVSYGAGCALGHNAQYGRYTEVRQYYDWIEETIKTATEQANP